MNGVYNDKQLLKLLTEIANETNPFGIMDVALCLGYSRNHVGLEKLDYTHNINSQRIGKLVMKSDDFERYSRKSSSHVRWMKKGSKPEV
jgi:hypothetical protein